jgi:putative lysine transport system substrate-binding protein
MKKLVSLILIAVLALSLVACGGTKQENWTGVEDGVLTVAMECAYAPYNWTQADDSNGAVPIKDSNEYANGYDVMMAKKICEANGWQLEVVRLDWDGLIPAVMSKQVDAVIAGQSMTAERMEQVDFAGPYLYATICCLVKADSALANATKIADFSGYRCTSQMSTIWYDSCLPQIEGANIQPAKDSAPTMLMALSTGDVDFVCTDMPTAQAALIAFPEFKLVEFEGENGFEVSDEDINIGISLKKGNTELKTKIDAVLSTMTATDFNALMAQAIAVQPLSE